MHYGAIFASKCIIGVVRTIYYYAKILKGKGKRMWQYFLHFDCEGVEWWAFNLIIDVDIGLEKKKNVFLSLETRTLIKH